MNLSQDEINSLMSVNKPEPDGAAEEDGIMSPEAIAAMLDAGARTDGDAEPAAAGEVPHVDVGSADIMSPEAIAAMLDSHDSPPVSDPKDVAPPAYKEEPYDEAAHALSGMLTAEEIDVLGEVGNISMGAVATTMYTLLDRRVSITTPRVSVFNANDVLSVYKVPFVVATIEYVEGISGNNLLVLRVEDAALITDILMGGPGEIEQPVELSELHLSAMSEIMNQMMGASSTSLSKLLQTTVNISPPRSSQVDVGFDVSELIGKTDLVTKISFDMKIEGLLESELIQLMPYDVSRDYAKKFMAAGMGEGDQPAAKPALKEAPVPKSQSTPPPAPPSPPPPQQASPPQQAPPPADPYAQPAYGQPYPPYPPQPYPPGAYQQAPYPPQGYPYQQAPPYPPQPMYQQPGRTVDVHPVQFQSFDTPSPQGEQKGIELVYNIPLQVTVELGKTKKEISEILEFDAGTIIVLDKIAGDPVEIVVNGKLIARGEVVVIDENYGVRITDIVNG